MRWSWVHATIFPRGCDNSACAPAGRKVLDIEHVFRKHVYGYPPESKRWIEQTFDYTIANTCSYTQPDSPEDRKQP